MKGCDWVVAGLRLLLHLFWAGDRASWHSMTELLSAPKPSPAPRLPDFSRIDLLGGIATVARTVGSAVTSVVASLGARGFLYGGGGGGGTGACYTSEPPSGVTFSSLL